MRLIIVTVAALLDYSSVISQTTPELVNTPLKLLFGFNIGTNYSNIIANKTRDDKEFTVSNGARFNLGIIAQYKLSNKLYFLPKAEICLNTATMKNTESNKNVIFPTTIDVFTHLMYQFSDTKISPYVTLGPSFKTPLIDQTNKAKKVDTNNTLKVSDFSVDIGLGINKPLRYFDIAPELRYSYGLSNLKGISGTNSLYYHSLSLLVHFKS